jgi:integrase
MENDGYSREYVAKIRREINHILAKAAINNWKNYNDVYRDYIKRSYSGYSLHMKRVILGLIERFEVHGTYPCRQTQVHQIVQRSKYHFLSDNFKAVIDYYRAVEKKRGIKDSTIYGNSSNAANFLFALQEKGITTLEAITEQDVLSVFVSADGSLRRCYGYKKNIASVLNACIPQNPEIFSKILTFLPAIKNSRRNIKYLLPEEIVKIKQVLNAESPSVSLRDKAMVSLALYIGLRSCDIAGLKIDSIDWKNDLIILDQQKTNIPLKLPLITAVGNAIYDYLSLERPETNCEYIFTSYNKPYRRLKTDSLTDISVKIMDAAGLNELNGSRGGFRIFRHHLATELLGNGVAQPVISRILGHTSPDSLSPYLSANFHHLKKCALGIERFPMNKGVLANV